MRFPRMSFGRRKLLRNRSPLEHTRGWAQMHLSETKPIGTTQRGCVSSDKIWNELVPFATIHLMCIPQSEIYEMLVRLLARVRVCEVNERFRRSFRPQTDEKGSARGLSE